MGQRAPHVCEAEDPSSGRQATFIFLHGYGDDAQGLPLGIAQQFQFHSKLPYLKWLLPNAPHSFDAMGQAWYMPKALPSATKPRVPGHEEAEMDEDDEVGILKSVGTIDQLVKKEIEDGVKPSRIIVGGFSQGCAVSLVWGLVGQMREKVGGVAALSGYLPLSERIGDLIKQREADVEGKLVDGKKKWLYVHGSKDMLVPKNLFEKGKEELGRYVYQADIEEHLYEGMSHTTSATELRDLLRWLEGIVPP